MAGKSEAVAQKKDKENLLWILRILFTLIFLIVVYYTWVSICTPWHFPLLVLAVIIFLIIIGLKSPPLLDAVLLLVIIFTMLFTTGILCPPEPTQCTFQTAGISCISSKLSANNGQLTLRIGQATGHQIRVTGVTCTQNTSSAYVGSTYISYSNVGGTTSTNVTMNSGDQATIADPINKVGGSDVYVNCTDVNSNAVGAMTLGSTYINGRIYVNYTETDTGISRIATAVYTNRYEA